MTILVAWCVVPSTIITPSRRTINGTDNVCVRILIVQDAPEIFEEEHISIQMKDIGSLQKLTLDSVKQRFWQVTWGELCAAAHL
mmetsp:Transcript_20647/g.39589  ORF Transcript_20647/g.39589 Transcript_20647/m.39589 type:complete len:84 (-) Transcript_20647:350-601(-)